FNPHVPNAHVSWFVIVPVAIFTTLFFVFAVGAVVRARRLPKRTGRERLVGSEGIVTSALEPKGVVQVAGERWTAESSGAVLPAGTPVTVVALDGLTLRVEPVSERVPTEGSVS